MKISKLLRAMIAPVFEVVADEYCIHVALGGSRGVGAQVSVGWGGRSYPARARECRIGHATFAAWGAASVDEPGSDVDGHWDDGEKETERDMAQDKSDDSDDDIPW